MQKDQKVKHDIIPYSASISFLNKIAQWQASLQVLQVPFQQLRIFVDTGMFAAAFTACRLGTSWELSISFLQKAHSASVPLDDVCRNGLVSALVRGNKISTAMDLAESVANFNSILMALSHLSQRREGTGKVALKTAAPWAYALQVLERMGNLGIFPTLGTFKAAASASKDRPDMVLPILETLKNLKTTAMLSELTGLTELTHFALETLDETSLNMLLSSLERCHRWQDALFHLSVAREGGLVPDLASYNSVISACAKVARWKAALGLSAQIPMTLKADEITLGSLVSACHRGHWSLAIQLLYEGRMQNIQPNRIMVHSAIVACEGQHWPWSLYLLEESISWRVAPDSMLIGAVMSSCERGHQWVRCLQLLSRCFAMHCPPDLPMLTSCISACGKSHRWEAMAELLREVLTFQVLPDPVMTHAALTAFASRPSRRYEQFAASLSATKGYIDNSDAAGRWAWSSGQLPAKEVMGGFTQQYLAEDLVDLRDLPSPLANAAMSDFSNNAFLRSVSMSWDPMSQDSCSGKVQGFIEHLGLGPGMSSVRTRQHECPMPVYNVPGEADLVKKICDNLAYKPLEVNNLSSKFASVFNEVVRSHSETPFLADKKNDGSFKKWLLACGFEVGPLFERNRSLVYLPVPAKKVAVRPRFIQERRYVYRGKHRCQGAELAKTLAETALEDCKNPLQRWEVKRKEGCCESADKVCQSSLAGPMPVKPETENSVNSENNDASIKSIQCIQAANAEDQSDQSEQDRMDRMDRNRNEIDGNEKELDETRDVDSDSTAEWLEVLGGFPVEEEEDDYIVVREGDAGEEVAKMETKVLSTGDAVKR